VRLTRYKLSRIDEDGWEFSSLALGRINLLVGDSGTGKSRLFNTIVNFSKQLVSERITYDGDWDIDFRVNGAAYNYKLVVKNSLQEINEKEIVYEELTDRESNKQLVRREKDSVFWKDKEIPKLAKNISTIAMLKEEKDIREIYDGFRRVVARRFFSDELYKNFQFRAIPPDVEKQVLDKKDVHVLIGEPFDFHTKMNLLRAIDPAMYARIVDLYKKAFPYVTETSIQSLSQIFKLVPMPLQAPVFCIKEKHIANWIPVNDISSGMQKIFLLILDLFLMKDSGILLIDEYENSLGINAINFLPDLIYTISEQCQFIITSHHPYIINAIPIEDWHVFHRRGLTVTVKSGREMKEKYKASKQEQFVQLINDPFYTGGVG
jgi:predicted ATPase